MNRYLNSTSIPRPIMKIQPSISDILHPLQMGERIDNLANKYYQDPTIGWMIMCANPRWDNEFEIPVGTIVRIPWPKERVIQAWAITNQI